MSTLTYALTGAAVPVAIAGAAVLSLWWRS